MRRLISGALAIGERALCSGWIVLSILGMAAAIRGFLYLPAVVRDSDRLPTVEQYAPLEVWAIIWGVGGVFAVLCAVLRRWLSVGFGVALGLPFMWATLYLIAWWQGESISGYITALTYLTVGFTTLSYYTLLNRRVSEARNDGRPMDEGGED